MTTNTCLGCGIILQKTDPHSAGYVEKDGQSYCRRCYRLTHYGEYLDENITVDYLRLIKKANQENALIIFFLDAFNLYESLYLKFFKYINTKIVFLVNKIDLIPDNVKKELIAEAVKDYLKVDDISIYFSSKLDYSEFIEQVVSTSDSNIYLLGANNTGKSTFLNYYLRNYTNDTNRNITTSKYLKNTLSVIEIPLSNNRFIYDTPGYSRITSFISLCDYTLIPAVIPSKKIGEKIYQVDTNISLSIYNSVIIEVTSKCTLLLYLADNIEIKHLESSKYEESLNKLNPFNNIDYYDIIAKNEYEINKTTEFVIEGLLVLTIVTETNTKLNIYLPRNVEVIKRKRLI